MWLVKAHSQEEVLAFLMVRLFHGWESLLRGLKHLRIAQWMRIGDVLRHGDPCVVVRVSRATAARWVVAVEERFRPGVVRIV